MREKHTQTEGEILDELQADVTVPWLYRWTKISHYYGDSVRELLIAAAVLMLATAPFYVDDLNAELPFIVLGAVAAICVAALTNPWKRGLMSADAIVAGVGLVIYEIWALEKYQTDPPHQFVLREAIALIFLFALYFSTKTLRGMLLNQIGQPENPREFIHGAPSMSPAEEENANWKEQAHEALEEMNEHEKTDFND